MRLHCHNGLRQVWVPGLDGVPVLGLAGSLQALANIGAAAQQLDKAPAPITEVIDGLSINRTKEKGGAEAAFP